jgi:hypothetical protein
LAGMQTVMMCVGICVVYSARNIPTRYNESRLLAIATFGTGVVCAIWFGLTWGLQKQIDLVGSITAFQAMLSIVQSIFVLVLVIGPKMLELRRDQRKQMAERDEAFATTTRSTGLSVSMSAYRKTMQGGRSDDAAESGGAVSMFIQHAQNPELAGASGDGGGEGQVVQRPLTEADVLAKLQELLDLEQEETVIFMAAEEVVREHKNKLIDLAQQVAEMRSSLEFVREYADAPEEAPASLRVAVAAPRSLRAMQVTAYASQAARAPASASASDSARLRGAHEASSDDVIVSEYVTRSA